MESSLPSAQRGADHDAESLVSPSRCVKPEQKPWRPPPPQAPSRGAFGADCEHLLHGSPLGGATLLDLAPKCRNRCRTIPCDSVINRRLRVAVQRDSSVSTARSSAAS